MERHPDSEQVPMNTISETTGTANTGQADISGIYPPLTQATDAESGPGNRIVSKECISIRDLLNKLSIKIVLGNS